jgi:hypothetical protein
LYAVNPLGGSIFDAKQPALNLTLEKGQSATFRYRLILDSYAANPDELNKEAGAFAAASK